MAFHAEAFGAEVVHHHPGRELDRRVLPEDPFFAVRMTHQAIDRRPEGGGFVDDAAGRAVGAEEIPEAEGAVALGTGGRDRALSVPMFEDFAVLVRVSRHFPQPFGQRFFGVDARLAVGTGKSQEQDGDGQDQPKADQKGFLYHLILLIDHCQRYPKEISRMPAL
jgi:hypothetical protein